MPADRSTVCPSLVSGLPISSAIATAAFGLIEDPSRHTTRADAVDADGEPTFGGTDAAVAWSLLGAIGRIAVLNFGAPNLDPGLDGWRNITRNLIAAGATHQTPHAEALRLLRAEMTAVGPSDSLPTVPR